jgi:hypothetical protein
VALRVTRLLLQDPVRIPTTTVSSMELQPLLWAGSWVARRKVAVRGTPNRLNYCALFTVETHFTNVAAGRIDITWGAA